MRRVAENAHMGHVGGNTPQKLWSPKRLIMICVIFGAFIGFLGGYLASNTSYETAVYIRPNTTLFLSPPGVNTEITITNVSDCVEIYENVRTVREYSLKYESPVTLSLSRNISMLDSDTIVLGQLQGIVSVSFVLLDVNQCMLGLGIPLALRSEQLEFSYFPYISEYKSVLRPNEPQIYNLSGTVNEYFKMLAVVSPVVIPRKEESTLIPILKNCVYSLVIIVETTSYSMGDVPHRSILYPSTVDRNKKFTTPIALHSLSPINEQTVVGLEMSATGHQLNYRTQLLSLAIASLIIFLVICIYALSGYCHNKENVSGQAYAQPLSIY